MCLLLFPKHCVGNVHHDNFQRRRAGAGWTDEMKEIAFLWSALCNNRSRELYGRGRGAALTCFFVFVNGGCILFIDAGTRVHLLDAKGLSFTENVFICICYCLWYIWTGEQDSKIQRPDMSWKYLFLPLLGILHFVGQFEQLLHLIQVVMNWTKSVDLQLNLQKKEMFWICRE